MVALRERYNLHHKERTSRTQIGDVVIIKGEGKNQGKWKLGIVENLYIGKDELVKAVGLRTSKSSFECTIQLLHPLELNCCTTNESEIDQLNPNVE